MDIKTIEYFKIIRISKESQVTQGLIIKHVSEYQMRKKTLQQEMFSKIFKTEFKKSSLNLSVISHCVYLQ